MHKTTDLPDGSGLVHHFEGMTRDKRPKDPTRSGTLQFAVLDHNGLDLCPDAILGTPRRSRLILKFTAHYLAVMSDADAIRFRKQADERREPAAKAISPLDKEAWLRVAEEWRKLALSAESWR